jgi:DNA polymerase-4
MTYVFCLSMAWKGGVEAIASELISKADVRTCENLTNIGLSLRERVDLPPEQLLRVVGVGISNFQFEEDATNGAATLGLLKPVAELLFQAQQ